MEQQNLLLMICSMLLFRFQYRYFYAQKYFREQQNTLGVLNSKIEEDYSGQIIIKSNSYEDKAFDDFNETNEKLATATRKAQIFSSLSFPVTHIFTNLGYVAVCALGGVFVVQGQINIGDIQAFIQYVSRFNRPITEIASTTSTLQALLAASERIFEFCTNLKNIDLGNKITYIGAYSFQNCGINSIIIPNSVTIITEQ